MLRPEGLGDLFFDQMDRRRDDVARRLVAQLNDVFAEIGLDRRDAVGFEEIVEADLLGHHRLAFGYRLGADRAADLQHRGAGLLRRCGPMHLAARSQDLAFVELEVEVEVLEGMVLDRPAGLAQSLEFGEPLDREAPPQRKPGSRETERPLQIVVGKAGAGILPRSCGWSRASLAYRGAPIGGTSSAMPGQHFRHMADLDAAALPIELAGDIEQTAEIAGQNRFGAGRDDIGCLVGDHLVGDLGIFNAERAAKAAAYLGSRQFLQLQPGDRGEELARLML